MIVPVLINVFARKLLAPFETLGIIMHLSFLPIFIIVLVVLAPHSSPSFVFTDFIGDQSGWTNKGVIFSIGLLTSTYTFTGFDGPLHMGEEVKNARTVVPQTMVLAVLTNGIMALGWMICLLFTIGNVQNALTTRTGYPIIEIFYQATHSLHGTNTLMAMLMLTGYVSLTNSLASVSRLTWVRIVNAACSLPAIPLTFNQAFARDNGLPFSAFFAYVGMPLSEKHRKSTQHLTRHTGFTKIQNPPARTRTHRSRRLPPKLHPARLHRGIPGYHLALHPRTLRLVHAPNPVLHHPQTPRQADQLRPVEDGTVRRSRQFLRHRLGCLQLLLPAVSPDAAGCESCGAELVWPGVWVCHLTCTIGLVSARTAEAFHSGSGAGGRGGIGKWRWSIE